VQEFFDFGIVRLAQGLEVLPPKHAVSNLHEISALRASKSCSKVLPFPAMKTNAESEVST
jgi:hypothetical protein